ncbi:MAG: dihydropteroate synthase [Propionibacteriaceae bacterium]|nr:dihydropteroate synthase [Propionibacteriaceae bacterium]
MTLVMGILNVTPDSFSDGGAYLDTEVAIAHARAMLAAGATIIDVGGESTRPGSSRVGLEDELARVVPIVAALAADGVTVSVDTMRAKVASAAIDSGARIINDVSGGLADPDMLGVVAQSSADFVLMHWRDHSERFQATADYDDVVADVLGELLAQRDRAVEAGLAPERIILDPGLGFSKNWDHNWTLLRHLHRFEGHGHRVLVGASRKAFLGELLGGREPLGRDGATAAVSFWAAQHGVWAVRTHDVTGQADAIAVARRLHREAPLPDGAHSW